MTVRRFGPYFPRVFTAALLEEMAFALFIHFPGYLSDLGATEGLIGLLYAASAIIGLSLRPALGKILDRTHRRSVILATGALNATAIVLLVTTSLWGPWLWTLFLVQRIMQLALFTTMLTYGADSIPAETRTQGLAIFGLSGLIPIGVSGYLGDVVIASFGFEGMFWLAATLSALSFTVVWTLPVLPVRGGRPRRSFWAAMAQTDLLPLWFATLLFSLGLETLFTFTRTYVDARQVGSAGAFFGVYGIVAAATRILGGRFYDRIPHRPLLVSSIAVYGVGLGIMALAGSTGALLLAGLATGSAHGAAFPLLSSEVVNRARVSERGLAMSFFTSIFDLALLFGAPAVGFIIEGFDYLVAFSMTGLTLMGGAVVYGFWDRRLVESSRPLVREEVLE